MINRELIRIKVVQLTYAYYQNGNKNMDNAEKELLFSISKAYDLYNYLLALIVAITQEERLRVEVATLRAVREGTPAPSQKFVNNKFALQLEENLMLNEFLEHQKQSWKDDIEFVRRLCNTIEQSSAYVEYMSTSTSTYDEDKELWRKLYRQIIQDNPDLDALLEEKSLYWNDDKEIVDSFVMKTIKRFKEDSTAEQELLPDYAAVEDKNFAGTLFVETLKRAQEVRQLIRENSKNWEFNRLAFMDVIIMQIALAEILTFPQIPLSVTFNEYLDIAKIYSTPKSAGYINGLLDHVVKSLKKKGELMK